MNVVTNPLLDILALPRFAEIAPDQIAPALDAAIAEHEAMVAALTAERLTAYPALPPHRTAAGAA